MGGLGSGRVGGRRRVDSMRKVDIRRLYRDGVLELPNASLKWMRGNHCFGSVHIAAKGTRVMLNEEAVNITKTPCHFGGSRHWFLCPCCNRRVAILYLGGDGFRCRHCYDLIHDSAHEGEYDQMLRKSRKLRSRLGASSVLGFGQHVEKPKYMHWSTYFRLVFELEVYEQQMARQAMTTFGLTK